MEESDAPIQKTDSGLEFMDLAVGTGPTPRSGQTVVVNYTGWLRNGLRFDSSFDRGQPLRFELGTGRVIAGWEEGVSTMRVGGRRRLIIPPALAYGNQGNGPIPPNSAIVFDVQLVGIED